MTKKFALESVCRATTENWELAFIDDSSTQHGSELVEQFFKERPEYRKHESQVKMYPTGDTIETKRKRGNSVFGKFANQAMEESDAEISVMLCDDDAVLPDYFLNLSAFFACNPDKMYSFCQVISFDPTLAENINNIPFSDHASLNKAGCINPFNALDSSQISWRREVGVRESIKFPFPQTHNLDAGIYHQMHSTWGDVCWNGFYGQYKGWFHGQLGRRGGDAFIVDENN